MGGAHARTASPAHVGAERLVTGRYYIEGLLLPSSLAPQLQRLLEDARRVRQPSAELSEWLRALDSTVSVGRRGVRPAAAGPAAGYLGVADVARELGCSTRHIRRLCEAGDLLAEKVGRDWRIPPGALHRVHRRKALADVSRADRLEERSKVLAAA